ncbi:hypothetical protein [Pseudoroseicyclus sp. CXY001]|uniref:hypothetical protein n=1 Tax=Pseudoroseicyclus sp. CXY001 TaxID=3242492 RepID=UPI00358DBC53
MFDCRPLPLAAMLLSLLTGLAGPAAAERVSYGTVRGWAVNANIDADGTFRNCVANNSDSMVLLYDGLGFTLGVPTRQPDGERGGSLSVDGANRSALWVVNNGQARLPLGDGLADELAEGSALFAKVGSATADRYSLDGTAATFEKLQECVERRGRARGGAAAVPAAPAPAPAVVPMAPEPAESDAARLGRGCPAWGQFRSPPGNAAAEVIFRNDAEQAVSIYWIAEDGEIIEREALLPDEEVALQTFAGQYFLAKDAEGTCHGGVIQVAPGQSSFVIP